MINYLIFSFIFISSLIQSQCIDYNQSECIMYDECEWFEEYQEINCNNFDVQDSCDENLECNWHCCGTMWGGQCLGVGYCCDGGSFNNDLSYCSNRNQIEARWHLVGYEDNVMYQFVDTELFADAGLRYTIYSTDGNFDDLDGNYTGGTPNPYLIENDIITIDMFFGTIVNYKINFTCNGQVVEFRSPENENLLHSTLFKEGYDYHNGEICQCENGSIINNNPCNPMECFNGQWYEIIIDCAQEMGVPCEGGLYIPPEQGECCSNCISYGDINSDYIINILDIIEVIQMVLDGNYNEIVDINYDYIVNVLDIIEIINMILD